MEASITVAANDSALTKRSALINGIFFCAGNVQLEPVKDRDILRIAEGLMVTWQRNARWENWIGMTSHDNIYDLL
jgi:hypothetical protein